tara:strand:+ start:4455 stop:5375 length:921 start_codon:yes stop_codon:yes gene_type:complete
MSDFNRNLFLKPQTNQYGRHMVMTDVSKSDKTMYINIDTKFRDEYNDKQTNNNHSDLLANQTETANYNISLPGSINGVKSFSITNAEIPMSFYNVSANLGNNYFKIDNTTYSVADNNYIDSGLSSAINGSLTNIIFTVNNYNQTTILNDTGSNIVIHFDINNDGVHDKFRFKSKLGWLLGFRKTTYTIAGGDTLTSEGVSNLNGSKYLYLAIDDFNRGSQNSFISPLFDSIVNKNIIARIALNKKDFDFGTIYPTSVYDGNLISDKRVYNGATDIQKLNVQLLNDDGLPIILNGLDFSFCMEIEYE